MTNALVIGCGNIGAGYDLADSEKIWTHAKAFSKTEGIRFVVTDVDGDLANKIGSHYNVGIVPLDNNLDLSGFDLVSIATPTQTHFGYIKQAIKQKVKVIICEKPVAAKPDELQAIEALYHSGSTKVIVNYMRRFQPAYRELKEWLQNDLDTCRGISIKYQRGFLNNGSHAFDIIEYLFQTEIDFSRFSAADVVFDAFPFDPTITGCCSLNEIPVTLLGVADASYAIFEIELFFPSHKIVICHSGDEIRFYKSQLGTLAEDVQMRKTAILSRYMLPVISKALKCLADPDEPDNFLNSIALNKKMLHVITNYQNS